MPCQRPNPHPNIDTLTVPTLQRFQVFLDLLHQGRQPSPKNVGDIIRRDVGHVHPILGVELEGNILRQHPGCEGRRWERPLPSLPYD